MMISAWLLPNARDAKAEVHGVKMTHSTTIGPFAEANDDRYGLAIRTTNTAIVIDQPSSDRNACPGGPKLPRNEDQVHGIAHEQHEKCIRRLWI